MPVLLRNQGNQTVWAASLPVLREENLYWLPDTSGAKYGYSLVLRLEPKAQPLNLEALG